MVDAMHQRQVEEHGGLLGLRDENALESALARPKTQYSYVDDLDLAALAAAYGWGLCHAHAYVDGNKRIALAAMGTFLRLNGLELRAEEAEVATLIWNLADDKVTENELAVWLRRHVERL